MKGKIGFMVFVCAMILFSVQATAVFEVPEGALTFESLGLSGTYDTDAIRYQMKEVTLRFAEPNDVQIFLATYRKYLFSARIYVEGILATERSIGAGNEEVSIIIPGAFIKDGENTIRLEFIDKFGDDKFSEYPASIAPKSYIMSTDAFEMVSHTKTPVYSPTPSPTIPTSVTTQIEIRGFSIQDVQKSSETAPEIHIEPIEEQKLPNTTVVLSGYASTDSEIESVTVNGQYAGTEYWSAPVDLSLGDNNIVIVATGKDGSTTVENISLLGSSSFTPDSKFWISKYIIPNILPLLILLLGTGLCTEIIRRYRKRRHQRPPT